jgi:DNA-binding NarL/FixJ family response regulator
LGLKILALGSRTVTRWITNSLFFKGAEVVCFSNVPGTSSQIKEAKYDIAVIDSYLADLETICFKLIWYNRLRVVIVTSEKEKDWSAFKLLGVDAFVSPDIGSAELATALEAVAGKGSPIFPGLKGLALEDDTNIREAIRLCFRLFWPEIVLSTASDGKSGLDILKTNPQDFILLDLGLPDISGFDVMAQIRAFSRVPILILTATVDKEYIVRAIQEGANDYIVKPFKQSDFMSRIKKQIIPVLENNSYSAFRFFF